MTREISESKKKFLKDLNEWYDEYDKKFPEWYRKRRLKARKVYEEFEASGAPIGKYGADVDLMEFNPFLAPPRKTIESYEDLSKVGKEMVQTVGQRPDEKERTASHIQHDTTPAYLKYTSEAERLFSKYPDGLVVMDIDEAIIKYSWLERYVTRLVPLSLDKYTAWNSAYSQRGIFVWVKEGVKVEWPLQTCFFLEQARLGQLVRVLVVAEPNSHAHVVSGCVIQPECETGLHGCISELYLKEGAEITLSYIHNFQKKFHVRPKVGIRVGDEATFRSNYIQISPVESTQLYPTVILQGKNSRASLRSLIFGLGSSDIDAGSAIILSGNGARGEIISRSVVTDKAKVCLRGALKAYRANTKGHLECRALLLSDKAKVNAFPNLHSRSSEAELTHEAAVGKIAEEELYYLMSRGLKKDIATSLITKGFLDTDIPGLPAVLKAEIQKIVSLTAEEIM